MGGMWAGGAGTIFSVLLTLGMLACVLAALHHTEVIAHRLGEPYGTLVLACLGAVVLLAKALAPGIESAVSQAGAPKAVVGVIIAAVVLLLPEGLAALRTARANRLQTSLNLALG